MIATRPCSPVRFLHPLIPPLGALILGALATGCGGRHSGPSPSAAAGEPAGAEAAADQDGPISADLIQSVLTELTATGRTHNYRLVIDRLNQYVNTTGVMKDYPLHPEIQLLVHSPQGLTPTEQNQVERPTFDLLDAQHLEECFLLHAVAQRAAGRARAPLDRARAVFDWVIRNIELVPPNTTAAGITPPKFVLVRGSGIDSERAWVFISLLRQLGIDAVMLNPINPGPKLGPDWIPGAVIDGQVYLFDTRFGLPIPGPAGRPVATLDEAARDPSLLARRMSVPGVFQYGVQASQVHQVVAKIVTNPLFWAPRMAMLQDQLAPKNGTVVSMDIRALRQRVTAALGSHGSQATVAFWEIPMVIHSMGHADAFSPEDRNTYRQMLVQSIQTYMQVPPLLDARMSELQGDLARAREYYLQIRDPESLRGARPGMVPPPETVMKTSQQNATYFLGTIKQDEGQFDVAADWFRQAALPGVMREVMAQAMWMPDLAVLYGLRWQYGARYNLGRCLDALAARASGNQAERLRQAAIAQYLLYNPTPQRFGNLLRADRLGWRPPITLDSPLPGHIAR